jgi:hypothetical protein
LFISWIGSEDGYRDLIFNVVGVLLLIYFFGIAIFDWKNKKRSIKDIQKSCLKEFQNLWSKDTAKELVRAFKTICFWVLFLLFFVPALLLSFMYILL